MNANKLDKEQLVSGVVIPTITLLACIGVFRFLGTTVPAKRAIPENSIAALMERLPAADVVAVRPLSDIGGTIDIEIDGEVVPYREISLAAEVAGQIVYKSPAVEAGNFVNKGDILFRVDPTDYELEISRLENLKLQEYERLREIDQDIVNVRKLTVVAEQDEELRKDEVERLNALPNGFASQSEIDRAQQSLLQATNTRLGQENQLSTLKKRRIQQEVAEALAETQLKLAQKNLQRAEVRSPIDGIIYREDVQESSYVQRGTVLVTLEDTSKAEVIAKLRMDQMFWVLDQAMDPAAVDPEHKSYQIPRTKATVEYALSARDEVYRWDGWLERYDGVGLDGRSRMVPVRVVVESPGELQNSGNVTKERIKGPSALVRGMYVKIRLQVKPQTPLVLVPNLALQPGNRLWKFEADQRVLETLRVDQAEDVPSDTENASLAASASTFDASGWNAGRLIVVDNITAITSIDLAAESAAEPDRYWICEIPDAEVQSGDSVVVSPLGSVTGDGEDYIRTRRKDVSASMAADVSGESTSVVED